MEEIEALVAAGGAVCELCKGQMLKADGCTWPGIYCKRRHWRDERCHDCGAKRGQYHHANCDVEQCPVCGGQLISCGCDAEYTNDPEPAQDK